ncbi:unnamed protein product [Calypogeia fissa]
MSLQRFVVFSFLCTLLYGLREKTLRIGADAAVSFSDAFHPYWGEKNIRSLNEGQTVQLSLDQNSGSGFASNDQFLYGYFGMQMKLVPGDSAGTLTSFYLSSKVNDWDQHDEVDFEFLGNVSGQPYILQTNVFTGGKGGREQRIYLWFDPTAAYHWYSIMWNRDAIVFWVDAMPIRSFKNNSDLGVPYLSKRPMALYSSMFDASTWATRGGLVGIDWTKGPFVSSYTGFTVMGCKVDKQIEYIDSPDLPCHFSLTSKWDHLASIPHSNFGSTDALQRRLVKWVPDEIMIYDYCKDSKRYPKQPVECTRNERLLN